MRKDRIEERISGIERDVKELRSEIRQEIMSMAAELKETQLALMEDMMSEMQEGMAGGYRQIAYDLSISNAEKRFRVEMSHDCPPGDTRDGCIRHFVEDHLRQGIARVDEAPADKAGEMAQVVIDRDCEEGKSFKGTPCEFCQGIYIAERDRLLEIGAKFATYRKTVGPKRSQPYYRQLPDDLTVSEIVDPLSHRSRFVMLKNLTSGCMSFKELGEVTGHEGGHLIYHLNKLTVAGLVSKEESGLYQITEKGMGVMEVIRKMHGR